MRFMNQRFQLLFLLTLFAVSCSKDKFTSATRVDTLMRFPTNRLGIPSALRESDIAVEFEYNTYNQTNMLTLPGVTRDTTAAFGLLLIDKTRKRSNYSESNKIRLKRP